MYLPILNRHQAWTEHLIGIFDSPVAVVACDVTKNRFMDLIIYHTYSPFMIQCDMAGGWVSWFETQVKICLAMDSGRNVRLEDCLLCIA